MKKMLTVVKSLFCLLLIAASVGLVGCSSTKSHESSGQYVDDSVITTKVKSAIVNDMALKGFEINVKTYRGVVQLSGFVDSAEKVGKAGDLARGVTGVTEVKNDLIIK